MLYVAAFIFAACAVTMFGACWLALSDQPHAFTHSKGASSQRLSMVGQATALATFLAVAAFVAASAAIQGH